jgi:hypothetical protein
MRFIAVLIMGVVMYVAVPMLWQRMMVAKVQEISANQSNFPVGNAVEVNWEASQNLVAGINGPMINQEEMNRFEQVGAQSAADQQMRQVQAAQDQAWAATH